MNIRSANNFNIYNRAQEKIQAELKNNADESRAPDKMTDKMLKKITRLKEMSNEFERFTERLEEMRKQSQASSEFYETQRKCMLIAMRIMQGDNVPHEDIAYLVENAPEMYAKAIIMRIQKEDPEDHERVSEEKEDDPVSPGGASVSVELSEIAVPEAAVTVPESGGDS